MNAAKRLSALRAPSQIGPVNGRKYQAERSTSHHEPTFVVTHHGAMRRVAS